MVRNVLSFSQIIKSLLATFSSFHHVSSSSIYFRFLNESIFYIFLILGTSRMFSSGSWATLNYLKLLPTPKTFNNSSLIPITSKNVFSSKQNHLPHNFMLKNNNKTELRIEETRIKSKSK
jgi:hypothetical protein